MPKYRLTYFPFRGRAEVIRYLLFLGGQEWEEDIIELKDWPSKKKDHMFGALPVLEEDGVQLCQSVAICSYLARKYGYAGTTPLEDARAEMIACCCEDMVVNYGLVKYSLLTKTPEEKQAGWKMFKEKTFPVFFQRFENILKQNKGGDGWIVGESLTWADISLYHWLYWFKYLGMLAIDVESILLQFPKLGALLKRVEAHPKIAQYLKEHPQTDEIYPSDEELASIMEKVRNM